MKELSIEEKARRYDEAIKKVNDYYEGKTKLYSDVDKTLDYLFPALKESEDERIRKAILTHFEYLKNKENLVRYYGIDVDEIFSWLEKQGKQKSIVIPKFRVGDVIRPKGSLAEYKIESISNYSYHGKGWGLFIGYEKMIMNLSRISQ